jgi:hypothetical protein
MYVCMFMVFSKIWKCAAFDVGSKNDAINYWGITVLPVISKIVEAVIRDRLQPLIHNMQNPTQRGFTKGSSSMNADLPVEEAYRILTDEKQNGHLVLLDAKTAFDKVKGRGTLVRHRFCFRRQTLHTFIFCECFIKWNNGSVRLTIWKQKIGDGLLNTTCACQSDRVCHPLQMNF